jgi:hypothetical protein
MKKRISLVSMLTAVVVVGVAHAQQGPITPEFVMANNDLNKDGVITHEEAIKAGKQLALTWDRFDANKDGKVTVDEIKKGLAGPAGAAPAPAPSAAQTPAAKATTAPAAPASKPATTKTPAATGSK